MAEKDPPQEVALIRRAISDFLNQEDGRGHKIGQANFGVYAFFDYDGEPIYVGQTVEGVAVRVGRHLTGRRSDAVAKFVLDPFEVLDIEVWPLLDFDGLPRDEIKKRVNAVEFAVFEKALAGSKFHAVLNEGIIPPTESVDLPPSYRGRIVPEEIYRLRKHPDVRIARRAQTIASLARLISERAVQKGIRTTLLVQSQRLEALAARRLEDFADERVEAEPESESTN